MSTSTNLRTSTTAVAIVINSKTQRYGVCKRGGVAGRSISAVADQFSADVESGLGR